MIRWMNLRGIKGRLGPLWWYTALMFIVNRMGDAVNIVIGVWLVPRLVDAKELGALLPFLAVATVYAYPIRVLLLPVPKYLNTFAARNETGKARALLRDTMLASGAYALVIAGFVLWTGDALLLRLKLSDPRLLWLMAAFAFLSLLTPVVLAAQQAFKLFKSMVVAGAAAPWVRLAGMLVFLPLLGGFGYLLAQLGLGLAGLGIAGAAVWLAARKMGRRESYRAHWGEMARYAAPLVLGMLAGWIQAPVESLVFRQRLAEEVSAGWYYVVMFGMIPTYFTGAVTPFLWALISDRFERGERTEGLMWQSLAFTFAVGGLATLATAWLMPLLFQLPWDLPWKPYAEYAGYIWVVCLMNVVRGGTAVFIAHETACRRFGFMWHTIPASLVCSALLYILPGWVFFKPWLPRALWEWCDARIAVSLDTFLGVMLASSFAVLAGMAAQLWARRKKASKRGDAATR